MPTKKKLNARLCDLVLNGRYSFAADKRPLNGDVLVRFIHNECDETLTVKDLLSTFQPEAVSLKVIRWRVTQLISNLKGLCKNFDRSLILIEECLDKAFNLSANINPCLW